MMGLIAGLLMCLIAAAAGRRLFFFIAPKWDADEEILFSFSLGFLILAAGVLGLGLLGVLSQQSLSVLIVVLSVIAMRSFGALETSFQNARHLWKIKSNNVFRISLILFVLALLASVSGVLAPETANDSLCYHLHVPKIFLQKKQIAQIPYEVNSLFPFFMEMLFTLGIAFKSISLAKTFHFISGLLTAAAIVVFGRRISSVFSSMIAAALFLTTPGVVNQLGTTYVDVSLSCFTFLALLAYVRWHSTGQNSWLQVGGIMAGIAMGIKYLALISILGISILILWDLITRKIKNPVAVFASFFLPLAVVASYWYLRSWIELGNPVYPYFYQIFKAGVPNISYEDIGVTKTLLNFIKIPWMMSMKPEVFEGFGDNLGPGYLAFLPLAFFSFRKSPLAMRIGFYAFFYLICWFFLGQSLRFFFPALPALALLIALGLDSVAGFHPLTRRLISLAVMGVFAIHTGLAFYHYRAAIPVAVGRVSAENYLRQKERSYAVAEYVNRELPKNSKILNITEVRMFYFERSIVREDVYSTRTGYDQKGSSPENILEGLRRDGFTHILFGRGPGDDFTRHGPLRVPRLLAEGQNSLALSLTPLYTDSFTGPDEPPITYTLYKL